MFHCSSSCIKLGSSLLIFPKQVTKLHFQPLHSPFLSSFRYLHLFPLKSKPLNSYSYPVFKMSKTRKRPFSGTHHRPQQHPPPLRVSTPPLSEPVPLDTPRFSDLAKENILHPTLLKTITEDLGFDHMMPVQAATLHDLLQNKIDCLAQAKTGTGKTIAFLLPAIQTMINTRRWGDSSISLLVLSPTRELAMQIAKEATAVLKHFPQYRVQFSIGGTNKNTEANAILSGCEILIATPGRLLDHLSDSRVVDRLGALQTLVLDEADRMLDMGFLPSIKEILKFLPEKSRVPRQSLLFSATVAGQIQQVAHLILNQGYKFISTIAPGEVGTHQRVPQHLLIAPSMSDLAPALVATIRKEATSPFKAIVFTTTAAIADFYGHILGSINSLPPTSVLHSRMTQSKRTRTTEEFRKARDAICVATDVIARGMDFPGVTHVFQVGMPMDKESYIHRLGRTARADADGRGILILSEDERAFTRQLKDIDFQEYSDLQYSRSDVEPMLVTLENKGKVYQAWLGYYKTFMKDLRWSTSDLIRQANIFAIQGLGCAEIPGIQKNIIGKMGLKGVPGLVVLPNEPGTNDRRRQGGGQGRNIRG